MKAGGICYEMVAILLDVKNAIIPCGPGPKKLQTLDSLKKHMTPAGVNPSAGGLPPETGGFDQEILKATYNPHARTRLCRYFLVPVLVEDDLGTYLFIAIC